MLTRMLRLSPAIFPRRIPSIEIEHLWMGVPVFFLLLKGFLAPLPLYDFWWHLKLGETIVFNGVIPEVDAFSFTATGKPFVAQNWLSEIIYYLCFRLGGLPLLVMMNAALLVAALLPVYHLCFRMSTSRRLCALVGFLVSVAFFANMRPQVFSFVFFSLFYWILSLHRMELHRRRIWWLPGLMLLWVNMHGAFVLGLVLIVIFLLCEWLRSIAPDQKPCLSAGTARRDLMICFLLCMAASLVNPVTYDVYTYIYTVLVDGPSQLYVMEWQPPRVNSWQGILLFYGLFFLSVLAMIYGRARPGLTEVVLFLCFSFFALTALRNTIWFAIVIAPILTLSLDSHTWIQDNFLRFPLWKRIKKRLLIGMGRSHHRLNGAMATVAAMLLILQSPWVRPSVYGTSLLSPETPVGAMDYIERFPLEGNILHPQLYGDYLIWRLWPAQKSFFDGRVHLFGESFVRDYQQLFTDLHWESLLSEHDIRFLLLPKSKEGDGIERMIETARSSGTWMVRYEDDVSVFMELARDALGHKKASVD